jgi:hypothetical protein
MCGHEIVIGQCEEAAAGVHDLVGSGGERYENAEPAAKVERRIVMSLLVRGDVHASGHRRHLAFRMNDPR